MKPNNLITLLLFSISALTCRGQMENSMWYFGNKAGIDFKQATPSPIVDSEMSTSEGVSSIADSLGNLLFYTDGSTIWDRTHQTMPNGRFLNGNLSTTQSALIVPQPCSGDSMYYVFTVGKEVAPIYYHIVNTKANNGLGDVVSKNKLFQAKSPEKITAIQHANGIDFWVLTHGWDDQTFYANLLSSKGIEPAIVSNVGSIHTGTNYESIGSMKPSHDGARVAVAMRMTDKNQPAVEILDFDKQTGILSNAITMLGISYPYGLEFSADNSKLYVTQGFTDLKQYTLSGATTAAQIMATEYNVATLTGVLKDFGQIQMAPDGRIYCAIANRDYLSVIDNPNGSGAASNFLIDEFYLGGKRSKLGLPNLPQGALYSNSLSILGDKEICRGNSAIVNVTGDDGYQWYKEGYPGTIISNNSTLTITPDSTTTYIAFGENGCPVSHEIVVVDGVDIFLGEDTTYCDFSGKTLDAGASTGTYLWSNGEISQTILIDKGGSYWVEVSSGNCVGSDTIEILTSSPMTILVTDSSTTGCDRFGSNSGRATVDVGGGLAPFSYLWDTDPPQTTSEVTGLPVGEYTVTVSDANGCETERTIKIQGIELSTEILILPSCGTCPDGSIKATVAGIGTPPYTYRWDDENQQTTQTAVGLTNGTYKVLVTDSEGCFSSIEVQLGTVGINDKNLEAISLFPNPNKGTLTLSGLSSHTNAYRVDIFCANGQLVDTRTWDATSGKLVASYTQLEDGLYYIRVSENSATVGAGSFLIKH